MEHNISSNIYYASTGSEVLRLARTSSGSNAFVAFDNQLLETVQKQGSKHKSIVSMLKKIFVKHFNVFDTFADTPDNFIKHFLLHEQGLNVKWIIKKQSFNFLFSFYVYPLFYTFVCWQICLNLLPLGFSGVP